MRSVRRPDGSPPIFTRNGLPATVIVTAVRHLHCILEYSKWQYFLPYHKPFQGRSCAGYAKERICKKSYIHLLANNRLCILTKWKIVVLLYQPAGIYIIYVISPSFITVPDRQYISPCHIACHCGIYKTLHFIKQKINKKYQRPENFF